MLMLGLADMLSLGLIIGIIQVIGMVMNYG